MSGDVLHDWFLQEPQPTFYVPMEQAPRLGLFLAIRTLGAPEEVTAGVRAHVLRADADQPIFNARTMRTIVSERLIGLKYAATVMGDLRRHRAGLVRRRIYGVMAYSVSRRTHEIGLRVHRDVLQLTVGQALRTAALGIGIGLVLAFFVGRLMESTLFGVVQLDGVTFAALASTLAFVSLLAACVPARRALAVDPAIALRVE